MEKNTRNIIIVILVIAVLIAVAVYFILNYKDNSILLEGLNNQQEKKEIQKLEIEDKEIIDNTKPFKINIVYPYINGLNEFNEKVNKIILTEQENFKKISLENDQSVKEIDIESYNQYPREYTLNINYNKGRVDEETVSLIFDISNFTGGAHGANYFLSLNYNPKEAKEIKLNDLFKEKDYLKKISDYCIKDLTKQIQEKIEDPEGFKNVWIEQGAGPEYKNFSFFLINENNITFYFPQYQIAPYALGSFEVMMPL
jgi:hypothetical protein